MTLCKCGCGEEIQILPRHKYDGIPNFIRGHNSRRDGHFIPTHNVKHSEESKRKMSEAKKLLVGILSPRYRKTLSDDSRKKISLAKSGRPSWNRGIYGAYKLSDKTKQLMSEQRKGANNSMYGRRGHLAPSWKGGVSSLRNLVESSETYSRWRLQVFKRDGYRCVKCQDGGSENAVQRKVIHAHHVKPLSSIILANLVSIRSGNYSLPELSDISNGVTLCQECHMSTHRLGYQGQR
jgi:hypothetical protein